MLEKVIFIKPHTHADNFYPVDSETMVTPEEARWLRDHEVIAVKAPEKARPAKAQPVITETEQEQGTNDVN